MSQPIRPMKAMRVDRVSSRCALFALQLKKPEKQLPQILYPSDNVTCWANILRDILFLGGDWNKA